MDQPLVNTKNVMVFRHGLDVLMKGAAGRKGMMLLYGPPGTGKTEVCHRHAVETDAVYVRCKYVETPRNLLESLVHELGEEPRGYTGKLYRQAVDHLLQKPRLLMFDEADYLVANKGMIEIVRDINDEVNVPIIITGMEHISKKLQRFPHLYDRIRAHVRFDLFDRGEINTLSKKLCEVELEADAIDYIHHQSGGKLRLTMDMFDLAERIARTNKFKTIELEALKPGWEREKKRAK